MSNTNAKRRNFLKTQIWLIGFIGVIVPRRLRADWRQEWEAELRSRETLLAEWDKLNWRTKLDLLRRSLGAFRDALLLQPKRLEDEMFQDLRFGARMLLKNKSFTAMAALSLALGIGSVTAIFSFVDAALLKPLGYYEAEQLVIVSDLHPKGYENNPSPPTFFEWRARNQAFSHLAAFTQFGGEVNLTGGERAERLQGQLVSANYFDLLGMRLSLGRTFLPDEDQLGKERVALLANSFWRRGFGADPAVVGAKLTLNNKAYTIVGVLPSGGVFDRKKIDVWLPLSIRPDQMRPDTLFFSVIGRLKPGVTLAQSNTEMPGSRHWPVISRHGGRRRLIRWSH